MSRKKGIFQEKHSPQKKNVPENATIPGENAAEKGKCPENRHKTWRKSLPAAKHPYFTPETWRKSPRKEKCPENRHKTRRNRRRRKKMSRKPPQNQEKPPPQKKNVPEIATKRGGTISAEGNVQETATKPGKGCKISPFKWYICKR
jgi:hypothetical protein